MNAFTNFRCVAFTNTKTANHSFAVDSAGNVRVWDDVAGHFTTCHILTEKQIASVKAKAAKEPKPAGSRNFHGH